MKLARFRIGRLHLILTIALVIGFALASGSCRTGSSNLYGKWVPATGREAPRGFPDRMELFSGGMHLTDGNNGIYSIVDGKLKLSAGGSTLTFDYELRGARLILKADGGRTIEYAKQK
jgi:hypothetical protein